MLLMKMMTQVQNDLSSRQATKHHSYLNVRVQEGEDRTSGNSFHLLRLLVVIPLMAVIACPKPTSPFGHISAGLNYFREYL